jgi:hypothetical protein
MRDVTAVWPQSAGAQQATRAKARLALFGALLAATAAACSAPSEDASGIFREAATFANDKTAYDYFLGKGLTNFQAAAVVGNLDQESGVNPTISQNGGGVGRGIAQWSTGARWDTTKGDNVMEFAAMKGQSATSLSLQLDFMWFELTTFPAYGLAKLKATTTLNDATQVFEDSYEGCVYANFPECALPSRQKYAQTVFNAYMNDPVPGGGGAGGATGSAGSAGANAGGSAGSGGASTSKAGANSGGGTSAAGAPSVAGAPSAAGTPGVAGAPSGSAGASVVAGDPGFAGSSSTNNDSSCAVARPGAAQGAFNGVFGFSGALLGLGLALRVSRRRRRP